MPNEYPVFAKGGKITTSFRDILSASSRSRVACTCCGRVHFYPEGVEEAQELREIRQQQQRDPGGFVVSSERPVWFDFGDKQVVIGCPCGYDLQLERVLWSWRLDLLQYYGDKASAAKVRAEQTLREVEAAGEALRAGQ